MTRIVGLCAALGVFTAAGSANAEPFVVDPNVGNNTLTAVFDAALGERITANSSQIVCTLDVNETTRTASGACSVPLPSIRVDNDSTKTEHFTEWATNKRGPANACRFEVKLTDVPYARALEAEKAVPFAAALPFTVCGRTHRDDAKEKVVGTVVLFPAGSYGAQRTLRIRAHIEGFNRDRYQIGPKYTAGWLARVQSLAKVVAEEGTIELTLFAKAVGPQSP